jgi:hypothetical protein
LGVTHDSLNSLNIGRNSLNSLNIVEIIFIKVEIVLNKGRNSLNSLIMLRILNHIFFYWLP